MPIISVYYWVDQDFSKIVTVRFRRELSVTRC